MKKIKSNWKSKIQNIKWTIPKNKKINDRYKIGDIIFVKKDKNFGQ